MSQNFKSRISAKLQERGLSGRQDLNLDDAKVIESGRAVRVLATYSPIYGPPSVLDIQNWLKSRLADYGDQVSARTETLAVYPERNFITFVVEQKLTRLPAGAAEGMVKAGVDQFIDQGSTLWELVKGDNGSSYLVKKDDVTVEQMLDVRRKSLSAKSPNARKVLLAAIDSIPSAGGGFAAVDLGDIVDFYANGAIHRGRVKSAGQAGVKIQKLESQDVFTVDPQAITSLIEKSAGALQDQDNNLRRYWQLVYPGNPSMAETVTPNATKPAQNKRGVEPIAASVKASVPFTQPAPASRMGVRGRPSRVSGTVSAKR